VNFFLKLHVHTHSRPFETAHTEMCGKAEVQRAVSQCPIMGQLCNL